MKNITINGRNKVTELEKEVKLQNGALVFKKKDGKIIDVYMVISFRDNKNKYPGEYTATYCSLVNVDTGQMAFEERCSRTTTVGRVLTHLFRLGRNRYDSYDILNTSYDAYDIEIVNNGSYTLDIKF
nr:MAG TPA: hypothetical protein [Caudoviricetes sp.]